LILIEHKRGRKERKNPVLLVRGPFALSLVSFGHRCCSPSSPSDPPFPRTLQPPEPRNAILKPRMDANSRE
jgi:hypothetical protein